MSESPVWDHREAKILAAVGEAIEHGGDPNRSARAAVSELSDELYAETVASLAEGRFLHAQLQRDGSGKISVLVIERLAPRGLEEVGRWRGSTTAKEVDRIIRTLSARPEADLETFFLAHGLGEAFASPGQGWGRQKRVNAALAEAERQGRSAEILDAARTRFDAAEQSSVTESRPRTSTSAEAATAAIDARSQGDELRWVFLVQGRNRAASDAVTALLESVGLRVLEWEQAVQLTIQRTGSGSPFIGDILTEGMNRCYAVVVLFTPDDIGSLHPALWRRDGAEPDEQQLAGRARQNVVFEAGMALGRDEARTVLVEVGRVAGFTDIAGRHAVRLDDSPEQRKALLDRLTAIGCAVDLSGSRWMKAGDLAGALTTLESYRLTREEEDVAGTEAQSWAGAVTSSAVTQWRPSGVAGTHPTDLVVASVVQVPAGAGISHDPHGTLATRLRGEAREEKIAELLAVSPLTTWLLRAAPRFNVPTPLPPWTPTGYNTGEWSELAIEPPGPDEFPPLISAHCKVNTGWIVNEGTRRPGLVLFTELRFRLLELDADRHPSDIRHETTSPPAPAALSLDEAMDALVVTLQTADTAVAACTQLTETMPTDGQAALWLTALGGAVDRVLDITEFRIIQGSSSVGEQFAQVTLPLDSASDGRLVDDTASRRIAAQLLAEMLERSGRRGTAERIRSLEQTAG